MHPAPSIIAFTTLSGLGFGLMAWLGTGTEPLGSSLRSSSPPSPLALAGAGLLASLLHLGQPTRFLKAFSQWRSSWLSREAVLAVATLAVFTLFAALWVLFGLRTRWLGVPAAALALATVTATAMIYTQMRSVPRWRSPSPRSSSSSSPSPAARCSPAPPSAPWLLAALGLAQLAAWLDGDRRLGRSGTTLATATGLGALGRLRLLEPPHTGQNYLLREMVFVVGRRHAAKLRATRPPPRRPPPPRAHPSLRPAPRPGRWPPSPTSRAPSSCAGSSLRRRNTWLDSTTEGANLPAPPAPEVAPWPSPASPSAAPRKPRRPASRRGCRSRRSAGAGWARRCGSCSSPAATPAAG